MPRRTHWKESIGSLIFVEIDYGDGRNPSRRLEKTANEDEGQFVGSLCENGLYAPALDVDLPVSASETGLGRTNVTFHREVPKDSCLRLLLALRDASLIAPSWARSAYGRLSIRPADVLVPSFEIKVPTRVLPSSTEGHFHVYFDAELSKANHDAVLDAFAEAGIIGGDFHAMAKRIGTTLLIKPGLTKRDLRPVAARARQWESAY
ncbi:MAG TPA: hypothetical protein VL500_05065 [Candidatus Eisenbacteria bacterium]|jgi:hypothetical protein|nr:hypothetical protein [Candidatus Eisenbacteria bacterium]